MIAACRAALLGLPCCMHMYAGQHPCPSTLRLPTIHALPPACSGPAGAARAGIPPDASIPVVVVEPDKSLALGYRQDSLGKGELDLEDVDLEGPT